MDDDEIFVVVTVDNWFDLTEGTVAVEVEVVVDGCAMGFAEVVMVVVVVAVVVVVGVVLEVGIE